MRIVQLANFHSPTSGGLRTAVDAVGRHYADAGHERVLIAPGAHDHDERDCTGRRIALASPRMPGGGGYRVITDVPRVRGLLELLAPDRIEVSDKLTLTGLGRWAGRHGIPAVLWSHERLDVILSPRVPRPLPLRRAARQWNRHLAHSFSTVVCSSEFAMVEWRRAGATNLVRIALGVDLSRFHPGARGAHPTVPTDRVRLVCVGRLSREKRPDVAVDALRALVRDGLDAELWMIGDGPQRTELETRAAGLPVVFTGHIAEPVALAALLAQADVAIAPCACETFGLAVLEALACGTPVVVPDAGASRELVVRSAAGIVAEQHADGFAAAVRAMLKSPIAERRTAARRRAEASPWWKTADAMLAVHGATGAGVEWRAS